MSTEGAALVPEIARLKSEQTALREQRKKLAKDLKNAEKRRSRLKKRVKLLTDTDLVAVMMLRVAERKEVKEAAKPVEGVSGEAETSRGDEDPVVPSDPVQATEPTADEGAEVSD